MAPRPFPFPLHVGTDICHIPRIQRVLLDKKSSNPSFSPSRLQSFLLRIFTFNEILQFTRRYPKIFNESEDASVTLQDVPFAHLAGRFAAKEAIIKATQPRRTTFRQVMLVDSTPHSTLLSKPNPKSAPAGPWAIVLDEEHAMTDTQREFLRQKLGFCFRGRVDAAARQPAVALDEGNPELHQAAEEFDGQSVRVSISHDGEYATAVCIAPLSGGVGDDPPSLRVPS